MNRYKNPLFTGQDPIIPELVKIVSDQVYNYFIEKYNKEIIVPFHSVDGVLRTVFENRTVVVGNPFTRYIVPPDDNRDSIIHQSIQIIVSQIETEMLIQKKNETLSVWNAQLGHQNPHGLLAHSHIKLNQKRPPLSIINMRY